MASLFNACHHFKANDISQDLCSQLPSGCEISSRLIQSMSVTLSLEARYNMTCLLPLTKCQCCLTIMERLGLNIFLPVSEVFEVSQRGFPIYREPNK